MYNRIPTKWLSTEFVPRGHKSNSPVETLGELIILIYEYSVRTHREHSVLPLERPTVEYLM